MQDGSTLNRTRARNFTGWMDKLNAFKNVNDGGTFVLDLRIRSQGIVIMQWIPKRPTNYNKVIRTSSDYI